VILTPPLPESVKPVSEEVLREKVEGWLDRELGKF